MTNSTHFSFTRATLDELPIPADEGARVVYHDTHRNAAGLQIRATHTGIKTFFIQRRIQGGRPERITIGRYPTVTIEQARKKAAELQAAIVSGNNPADIRRAIRGEQTFSELFADFLELHAKQNKKTWAEDQQRYNQYLSRPFGSAKLSAIDRRMISLLHGKITRDGHPTVANRILALISSIFGWGIRTGRCESNPALGIKRNKEISRDRFLRADELPRFIKALQEEPNDTIKDFFWICLLTGARRTNVLEMHYKDIDLDRGEWHIADTKNGTPQTITLSAPATAILKTRKPKKDAGFVFPSHGKSGHLEEPKKGWQRILERAELENLRPHDLRRTLGSWMAMNGASLTIIGKSLNHKHLATTQIYARVDLDPVRMSVNTATQAMLDTVKKHKNSSGTS